ncbi:MAG: hypothetical protein M1829_002116 [Trizodia sp. TS-e1964]|nr:MAG: hypothetical protein M1829_002116 [Trizodia sp. TS-e1964]
MASLRYNFRVRKQRPTKTSSSRRRAITTSSLKVLSSISGPYNRNFQQHLLDNGIHPPGFTAPDSQDAPLPVNWWEIKKRLARPRGSLTLSNFGKVKQIEIKVIPIIEGQVRHSVCIGRGPLWNLDELTDGTIVPGNPDLYYGARPQQLDRRVRDEIIGHIIPSTQDNLPLAPNFFLAVKGPQGTIDVAENQASYDGSLGARGMHTFQTYGQNEPDFDHTAATLSSS